MTPTKDGSLRIFRFAGIDVFVHWSWLLVAYWQISQRRGSYSSDLWTVLEYVALFAIVLLHEFGHSLACRQVGGRADRIVLWPLGGVAYVQPPRRPGATLWSIAAGPLVNVVLLFFFGAVYFSLASSDWAPGHGDATLFIRNLLLLNAGLLVFNLLPIYPLDGGQILQSLLWFVVGEAKSLYFATTLGFAGAGLLGLYALYEWKNSGPQTAIWIGVIAVFMFMNCRAGFQYARYLAARERGEAPPLQ